MRQAIDIGLERLRGAWQRVRGRLPVVRADWQRGAEVLAVARAHRRTVIVGGGALLAAIILVVVAATWTARAFGPPAPSPVVTREGEWRYLVVCDKCKRRTYFAQHPATVLPAHGPLLKCEQCGQFSAAWYRRGSMTVPPGGW